MSRTGRSAHKRALARGGTGISGHNLLSTKSLASILSIGSVGSIGSAGSILSIGSAGSSPGREEDEADKR